MKIKSIYFSGIRLLGILYVPFLIKDNIYKGKQELMHKNLYLYKSCQCRSSGKPPVKPIVFFRRRERETEFPEQNKFFLLFSNNLVSIWC